MRGCATGACVPERFGGSAAPARLADCATGPAKGHRTEARRRGFEYRSGIAFQNSGAGRVTIQPSTTVLFGNSRSSRRAGRAARLAVRDVHGPVDLGAFELAFDDTIFADGFE
ncbi:hypothetical protein SAMN05216289_11248 [Dokdonella immobilis]|uniref:Uncharacterized protein n=1 Tax=Dokdonella immobilis TaxID=578942 RepID=A0A1I4XVN8_9GAMM|nr:hypothetical protein SAMN05216289_11248 [Dokdonella immobilis]